MPCYSPLRGYRSRALNASGKRSIVFDLKSGYQDMPVLFPCGQCIGCRLERSRQWAVRCVHEASLHDRNCFVTLTFSDEYLKPSLCKRDFVLFMKRLRKRFGQGIRFFHCGEYGEKLSRPHHHACLFNFDFPDKYLFSFSKGVCLYRSPSLEELWPYGFSTVGALTFDSAAYVARYVLKKVTGSLKDSHYGDRLPEYITMSRKPGIAHGWISKFYSDVYPKDFLVLRDNVKCRPVAYYDSIYDHIENNVMNDVRFRRRSYAKLVALRDSPERIRDRQAFQELKFKSFKRSYEDGS